MEILTALLVLITGVYVFVTYKILRANERVVSTIQEQINSSVRPYIYFDLAHGPLINAKLKNTGITAGYNVSVQLDPQLYVFTGEKKLKARITSNTISLMPPGKEIEEFIAGYPELEKQTPSLKYKGTLNYCDVNHQEYIEEF